ncbi:MAG: hypothetical protein [Microvirus sp.]|nr:MAG: hypothetical protein [Microvirus sp.]WNK14657.1 MAG: hypothetical protein [Microvirus sp.]
MSFNRKPVGKSHSAHQFKRNVSRTHPKNMQMRPMRGGWRL